MASVTVVVEGWSENWEECRELARVGITGEDAASLVSQAMATAGVIVAREYQARGYPLYVTVSLSFVAPDELDGWPPLKLKDVIEVIPEPAQGEEPHPRHHGYKNGFGSER